MRPLPPRLKRITIPALFSPTQLAIGEACLLRVVGGSDSTTPRLSSHPAAAIGRIFHRLLELAVRGQIDRHASERDDVRRKLAELIDQTRARLARDAESSVYADLPQTLSPLEWRRKSGTVVGIAARFLALSRKDSPSALGERSTPSTFGSLPDHGEWAEVRIDSPILRLAGRIDVVEKAGDFVTIRDLKSGRFEDSDGQILPHIDLQLRLYGLMALEIDPTSTIRLVIDDGEEHEIPFDRETVRETRQWLHGVIDRLPVGAKLPASDLARVGEWCGYCPLRHVCGRYLETAPGLWRVGGIERLPPDIWGKLENIRLRPDGHADLTLRDAAERKVKIFGVRTARLRGLDTGDHLWLFGLRARIERSPDGGWRHPLNFYEVADDDPRDRAWSLELFSG